MKKITQAVAIAFATTLIVTVAAPAPAHAGGTANTLGVGAEFMLSGPGGVSATYDAGLFHFGGFLGFSDQDGPNNTNVDIGGRFYYHLHATPASDFGIGGQIGFGIRGQPGDDATGLFIDPGVQIRAFISNNVCLSFTAGFALGLIDASGVSLSGQPNAGAGIHYYFF